MNLFVEASAKMQNKRFMCKTLNGNSENYNLTINSDMKVSCNCVDRDRSGVIGSLKIQNINEILNGNIANNFRKKLSNGTLPTSYCFRCQDLKSVRKNTNSKKKEIIIPKSIRIENTANCNIDCIACSRKEVYEKRTRKKISLDEIEIIAKELKKNKTESICYFNLGEPFISINIRQELEIIRKYNPNMKIIGSTNGTLIDNDEKIKAALLFDHIYFSIPGPNQKIISIYQKRTDFNKAYDAMKQIIIERNKKNKKHPIIEWKYILFNWNDNKKNINETIKLAKDAHIDAISFWKTLSPIYGISFRYYLNGFVRKIGHKFEHGRRIVFKK